jgi:hypothetical protein
MIGGEARCEVRYIHVMHTFAHLICAKMEDAILWGNPSLRTLWPKYYEKSPPEEPQLALTRRCSTTLTWSYVHRTYARSRDQMLLFLPQNSASRGELPALLSPRVAANHLVHDMRGAAARPPRSISNGWQPGVCPSPFPQTQLRLVTCNSSKFQRIEQSSKQQSASSLDAGSSVGGGSHESECAVEDSACKWYYLSLTF